MSRSPGRDLLVGVFVLLGIAALAYLSLAVGGLSRQGPSGFLLTADFDELGGLKTRAPVVISGVKVGQVRSIALGDDYRARVTLDIDPRLHLPKDTSASIVTAGLLGDRTTSATPDRCGPGAGSSQGNPRGDDGCADRGSTLGAPVG